MESVLFPSVPAAFSLPCAPFFDSDGSLAQRKCTTVRSAPLYPVEVAPNAAAKAAFDNNIAALTSSAIYSHPQSFSEFYPFPLLNHNIMGEIPPVDMLDVQMEQSYDPINSMPPQVPLHPLVGSWTASEDDGPAIPTPQLEAPSSISVFALAPSIAIQQSDEVPQAEASSMGASESCFFYRNPNLYVRQRTAQACDKCRDRKTKVSLIILLNFISIY